MTVLFRTKNMSINDSVSSTFSNIKEKLEEYENSEDSE